ncbi:methyltransferase domain-containing protein [Streptomyces sp. NPDC000594]|uniref:SAM-dependent methyltransferase n=1 Tax=Streptomyces sp. NPDC000594 TaxID=3154261 RepID=UPI003332BE7D
MSDRTPMSTAAVPPSTEAPSTDTGEFYDTHLDLVGGAADGNIHSGYWADETDTSALDQATDRLTDLVAARLAPVAGSRLLDVGCGTGRPALRIATATGARVTGVTVSRQESALAQARGRASAVADQVEFRHADVLSLPFGDAVFDGAWAIECLMHIADRARALAGIARTLRPGARLVIADVLLRRPVHGETAEFVARMCEAYQAPSLPGPEEYREAVRAAGLHLVEFTDIGEQVRRTYAAYAKALTAAAPGGGAATGAAAGEADTDPFLSAAAELPRFGALPELGYALLITRRPQR